MTIGLGGRATEGLPSIAASADRDDGMKREPGEWQREMGGMIYAVSQVVETKDPDTAAHQRRVAELARAIAGAMGLSAPRMMSVYIAGLFHDLGKVEVPAGILSKPGKISEFEFSIIKNHPRAGCEILERLEFPGAVTTAVLQHHERCDGSGYPEGLSGDDILLEARILGVADVVDAMSTDRPYRPAPGRAMALAEITAKQDVLYDGAVVNACLNLPLDNRLAQAGSMAVC